MQAYTFFSGGRRVSATGFSFEGRWHAVCVSLEKSAAFLLS